MSRAVVKKAAFADCAVLTEVEPEPRHVSSPCRKPFVPGYQRLGHADCPARGCAAIPRLFLPERGGRIVPLTQR
eukprot:3026534-Pleurochrysis_carterae.AAC.1